MAHAAQAVINQLVPRIDDWPAFQLGMDGAQSCRMDDLGAVAETLLKPGSRARSA